MNNDNDIKGINVYEASGKNIFTSTEKPYQIPLYQRAYAWEDTHLVQLLEDISENCSSGNSNYYIGSLVVADKGTYFEVIDGQQRLTSLYLLLHCLGETVGKTLKFACRDKSNYTLTHLSEILSNKSIVDHDKIQESIINGVKVISSELAKTTKYGDIPEFIDKLSRVVIYRIVVPLYTDLNRYFETMNTRGEQLEQHDILKATLMSYYGENDRASMSAFAEVWEACSDMNGYVQMNFSKESREFLFGSSWGDLPSRSSFKEYKEFKKDRSRGVKGCCMRDMLSPGFCIERGYQVAEEGNKDARVRFESIIEFPYFLLHCLKTYVCINRLGSDDGRPLCESLLNDKRLISAFDRVISHGLASGKKIDPKKFAEMFILHMLRTRFLFDKYILKREFMGDSIDGAWSLKTLHTSGQRKNKRAYFADTSFLEYYQRVHVKADLHSANLMIQAALRVSYTSPKVMHWITRLLEWLSCDSNLDNLNAFCDVAEEVARDSIRDNFFKVCDSGLYQLGIGTPHIVFNYLDYLLWQEHKDESWAADFTFEFRNSVEHWYPRNPSDIVPWTGGGVDRFGNLCIIQRNVNSKFSNLPPEGKQASYTDKVKGGSLKLRLMNEGTTAGNNCPPHQHWRESVCAEHEEKMIKLLKEACYKQ